MVGGLDISIHLFVAYVPACKRWFTIALNVGIRRV
jgi:hypothetical protein